MIIFKIIKNVFVSILSLGYFAFGAGALMSLGQCGVNMAKAGGEIVVESYRHSNAKKEGVTDFHKKKLSKTVALFKLKLDKIYWRAGGNEHQKDKWFKIDSKLRDLETNSLKLLSEPTAKNRYEEDFLKEELERQVAQYIDQTALGKPSDITKDMKRFMMDIDQIIRENGEY